MRVAVTVKEPSLEAEVEPRFGRCPYFLIVETNDLQFEAIENPNASRGSGAGIQSAQLMAQKGAEVVLTGNCGPNAYQAFSAAGIEVVTGCQGVARRVVEQFKEGQLGATTEPNVVGHFGLGNPGAQQQAVPPALPAPTATGRGQGRGGGRGRGRRRGMGRGRAGSVQALSPGPNPAGDRRPSPNQTKEQQLQRLTQQAEDMNEQMLDIQKRIRQLEEEG